MPTPGERVDFGGGITGQWTSPSDTDGTDDTLERAAFALRQLQAWRERGYTPQLHGRPDGWVLTLGAMDWAMGHIDERGDTQRLRFVTAVYPTPEDAIEAALKVIQP